jgi:hypothetical protein
MVNHVKKAGRWVNAISAGSKTLLGKNLSRAVSGQAVNAITPSYSDLVPMKKGSKGAIKKKTVPALLHKGEVVLTASQVKTLKKILA